MRLDQLTPDLIRRMASVADQKHYAEMIGITVHQDDLTAHKTQPKGANQLEKKEQSQFANDLLRKGLPYVWHSTARASTATPGCPDFILAIAGVTLWVEFKRPGYKLSEDQEKFRVALERQGIFLHVVYSADQAIKLVDSYDVII
jgi:hypothetical protein